MVVVGWAFDRGALERLAIILKTSGRSPTDFIALAGFGAALANMGLAGAMGVAYVLATGGDLNGPSIGAILMIVGFAAFGKHPRNIAPVMIGVFLGALARSASPADPSLTFAALFGTARLLRRSPAASASDGELLWAFVHSAAALTCGRAAARRPQSL